MTNRVLTYLRNNVLAILALTVAHGTGGAYAANTIRSSDIVDGEVGSADIKDTRSTPSTSTASSARTRTSARSRSGPTR